MKVLLFLCLATLCLAVPPWEPSNVNPWAGDFMKRHQGFVDMSKAHANDIKVVFLGDSITEGWGGNGKSVWDQHYANRGAYNYGIGGDTTQNVIYRIQNHEFDGLKPKFTVLKIGTNNMGSYKPEDVAHGVKEIVNELLMKMPNSKILLLSILPRVPADLDIQVKKTNEIIAKLGDNKKVFYLDMSSHFEKDGKELPGLYAEGLHLVTKGYQVWYETMEPLFKKLYEA